MWGANTRRILVSSYWFQACEVKQRRKPMRTPPVVTHTTSRLADRKLLTTLSQWTIATLAALLVLLIDLQVGIVGQFSPPLALILGLPAVVVTVLLLTTGWRWKPLLAVLYWI